jgi:hypothetical protein
MRTIDDFPYPAGGSPTQVLDLCLLDRDQSPSPAALWIHGGVRECGAKPTAYIQ